VGTNCSSTATEPTIYGEATVWHRVVRAIRAPCVHQAEMISELVLQMDGSGALHSCNSQEVERLRMIRYSPGETRYDPSVSFLPSFKRLSLSNSLPFSWPPAERGGDALRQQMMRCFPGETRHDPTVGILTPLRGPGPRLC